MAPRDDDSSMRFPATRSDVATLRSELATVRGDIAEVKDRVAEVSEAVAEHRVRLENGTKVFEKWDDRMVAMETAVTPKPVSVMRVAAITLALVTAGGAALWGLSERFSDRPTVQQIDRIIEAHQDNGHRGMREEVRAVQIEQAEQRTLLSGQGKKLDELLMRVPASRPR